MSEEQPKYKNPIWLNKENRSIECDILYGKEYQRSIINAGLASEGYVNRDYDQIMIDIGETEIDRLTVIDDESKAEAVLRAKEQEEVHKNRIKQETLFEIKLEAFEIPIIKNSKNSEMKKKIRRAKNPLEVTAYATILIQEELGAVIDD